MLNATTGTLTFADAKVDGAPNGKSPLVAPPFPPLPIRVQMQSSAGDCLAATFSTAASTARSASQPD